MKYKKIGALSNIGLILGATMVILGFIEEKSFYAITGWVTCSILFGTVIMLCDVPKNIN